MVIGSIHQEKNKTSRFEYYKEGKLVMLENKEEVEILCARDRSDYKWQEVTVGQKVLDGMALEFPGNPDDHFYAVAIIGGKLQHQCATLDDELKLKQPIFAIEKK